MVALEILFPLLFEMISAPSSSVSCNSSRFRFPEDSLPDSPCRVFGFCKRCLRVSSGVARGELRPCFGFGEFPGVLFDCVPECFVLVKRCEDLLARSTLSSGSWLTSSSSRWSSGCGAGWVIAFATCLLPLLIERICTKQPIWKE